MARNGVNAFPKTIAWSRPISVQLVTCSAQHVRRGWHLGSEAPAAKLRSQLAQELQLDGYIRVDLKHSPPSLTFQKTVVFDREGSHLLGDEKDHLS